MAKKKNPVLYIFVVFAIVLAFIMVTVNLVEQENERYEEKMGRPDIDELFLACNQNVRLNIIDSCYDKVSNEFSVSIRNLGTIDIAGMNFFTEDNFAIDKAETIAQRRTTLYTLVLDNRPKSITLIPEIVFNGENRECTTLNQTINTISDC